MCGHIHLDYWQCVMIEHPETPDQHWYVAISTASQAAS